MHRLPVTVCLLLSLLAGGLPGVAARAEEAIGLPPLDRTILETIFSGRERLHYAISWSGGIRIGDLVLEIGPAGPDGGHAIHARVTDYGLFRLIYPVDDTFTTMVRGPFALPYRYEVLQKEGRGRETRRLTLYDQQELVVRYRKNDNPWKIYQVAGVVYNEYSSFFVTRALPLTTGREEIVPTFVDGKRHEVAVSVLGREKKQTIFGDLPTIKVLPRMHFKGLYDKKGDTLFWLTDDACRVPVEIRSKILVGSLVAELIEYANPRCTPGGREVRAVDMVPAAGSRPVLADGRTTMEALP